MKGKSSKKKHKAKQIEVSEDKGETPLLPNSLQISEMPQALEAPGWFSGLFPTTAM